MRARFTLLEILVVVAVILILAGLLLPALNRTVRRARKADCLGQMKNLGTAMMLYADEWDSHLAPHNDDNYGSNWVRSLYVMSPYYQDAFAMTLCPSDDEALAPPLDRNSGFAYTAGQHYWGYVYNMRMSREFPDSAPPSTVTLRDFEDPMNTVTYFEGDENDGGVENNGGDGPVDAPHLAPYVRHYGGANYLRADGHAEYLRPNRLTLADFTTELD